MTSLLMFGCSNLSVSESEPTEDIARVAATEQSTGSITSKYSGARFSTQAASILGVSLKTN
ncbi:hypothetical protein [Treponema sp.]|uniref:hypothetical protein n=1 Tax=Treponema sp. TaxID=166 RepID=UPI003FD8C485